MAHPHDLLVRFAALSRDKEYIAFREHVYTVVDRLFAVGYDDVIFTVFSESLFDLHDNVERIFVTGIVRSEHGKIGEFARRGAHDRTLLPVAVAAAAEYAYEAPLAMRFEGAERLFQSVGSMRKIDENIRAAVSRHVFQPSVHFVERRQPFADLFGADAQ